MSKVSLLIADSDERYLKGLVTYLTEEHFLDFKIVAISDAIYLQEYIGSNEAIDILLISEKLYESLNNSQFINSVIILSSCKYSESDKYIYKYQSGNKIYEEVKKRLVGKESTIYNISQKEKQTKAISVYSPIGGSGKSTLSLAITLKLAYKARDVLYLNYEDIPSTEVFFECEQNKSMSDLLYLAKDRSRDLKSVILSYLQRDSKGIYYFTPINSILDYTAMNSEDIEFFIEELKGLKKFDYIIIDLSSKLTPEYSRLLKLSDNIINLIEVDKISLVKNDIFLKQQESLTNYHFVLNKVQMDNERILLPFEMKREKKSIIHKIEYYDFLNKGIFSKDDLLGQNSFDLAINELIQKIFRE